MKILTLLTTCLIALTRNPMRAILTVLGIVIGIAAVVAIMEIGAGSRRQIKESVASLGADVVMAFPAAMQTSGVNTGAGGKASMYATDCDAVMATCGNTVLAASPSIRANAQIIANGVNWKPESIASGNESYLYIENWSIAEGQGFTKDMVDRADNVCVIGKTIKEEVFGGESPIGQEMRIRDVIFTVIGVLEEKGAGFSGNDQDDTIIMPWSSMRIRLMGSPSAASLSTPTASSNTGVSATGSFSTTSVKYYPGVDLQPYSNAPHPLRTRTVNSLIFKIKNQEDATEAMDEITVALRAAHGLEVGKLDDFMLRDRSGFTKMVSSTSETVSSLLLVVAMISLVVGGVGIMNIMMVSVTERTREIGLRMAVGARPRDIMSQFLLEAVMLCLVGGIIGILVGRLASTLVSMNKGWMLERSTEAIILSVSTAVIIGLVFGWYPAYKASRMDPIDALRHE